MTDSFDRSRLDPSGDGAGGVESDPTTNAREALALVEGKMRFPGGLEGISEWMASISAIVEALSAEDLESTRAEIRDLIDQLLELNAQIQNVVRLKQLLS